MLKNIYLFYYLGFKSELKLMLSYKNIIVFKLFLLMCMMSTFFAFSQPDNNLNFSSWSKEDGLSGSRKRRIWFFMDCY